MKIKVGEATQNQLNWMVAKCEPDDTVRIYFDEDTGEKLCHDDWDIPEFNPTTDWSQGGPIIEREKIGIMHIENRQAHQQWAAGEHDSDYPDRFWEVVCGPTPLIAAMRCFVASRLGDEVEIPEELI